MTQIFDKKGNVIPITIIKSGPCYITQIKTKNDFGYSAIQLGYIELNNNSKKLTKPNLEHFKNLKIKPFQFLKEYKMTDINLNIGDKFTVENFKINEKVNITGITIGKGNTGNIKRHHFSRGPMSHGSKHHRLQGSLGASTTPARVFPGKRMPGRVGGTKCTILSLQIVGIDIKENLLLIKGSIPGNVGNLVSISSKKI